MIDKAKINCFCLDCNCGATVNQRTFWLEVDNDEKYKMTCPFASNENYEKREYLKVLGEENFIGIDKTSMMTPQQRQKMLSERSREHTRKLRGKTK